MAGQRKAEGIALLSVYGGDDDDVVSQGSDEDKEEGEEGEVGTNEEERGEKSDDDEEGSRRDPNGAQVLKVTTRIESQTSAGAVGVAAVPAAVRAALGRVSATAGGLGIVDYAQDEGLNLSPDAEDGEYLDDRSLDADGADQPDDGIVQGSPSAAVSPNTGGLESGNSVEGSKLQSGETANIDDQPGGTADQEMQDDRLTEPMEFDILNEFLPPRPTAPCSAELQAKVSKYLAMKRTGKSLNEGLRNTKGYRNPDFLQSAVRHYDIDHIGSCFNKEVFDPHGYDQADYFDAIAQEVRREADRKDQERRQNQRVDFVRSSLQGAAAAAKPIMPIVHKVNVVSVATTEVVKTEGRASKKSKWDKVDADVGRPSQALSSAADAIAAANAHAALLTASANAGAGYASFAQQRRREAEEKLRVNDKPHGSSKQERKTERS